MLGDFNLEPGVSLLWLESGPGSGEEAFQLGVAECKRATRKRRREEAQQK